MEKSIFSYASDSPENFRLKSAIFIYVLKRKKTVKFQKILKSF